MPMTATATIGRSFNPHAREGVTAGPGVVQADRHAFQSTRPRGRDVRFHAQGLPRAGFNPHAREGVTVVMAYASGFLRVSIHTPARA